MYKNSMREHRNNGEPKVEAPTYLYMPWGVDAYRYKRGELDNRIFLFNSPSLTIAQERIREISNKEWTDHNKETHHFLLHFVDQFGVGHYQKWSGDMNDMFAYDDKYAEWANGYRDDRAPRPRRIVDPYIEGMHDQPTLTTTPTKQ